MNEFLDFKTETLSVGEFINGINNNLRKHTGRVEGEVTSIKNTYPTAVYFSIKDTQNDALLNCVIWKSIYTQNGVHIKEGDIIIITGTPEIYPARGSFSMKVNTIEYAGEGALKKAYDELKFSLEREGLFAVSKKRPLPLYPKRIGVITSRSGVVIQDFNANLGRYGFEITMVDSRVEGKDAIHELLAALRTIRKQDIEVLVIMRGGGSWESLQPFNTESVVRAIANFPCPVLTGIGHDVDVTLSELVADVGASTPTAVAETLNQTWDTLRSALDSAESRVKNAFTQRLSYVARTLESHQARLLRRFDSVVSSVQTDITVAIRDIHQSYQLLEKTITQAATSFQNLVTIIHAEMKAVSTGLRSAEVSVAKNFGSLLNQSRTKLQETARYVTTEQKKVLVMTSQTLKNFEHSIKIADPARTLQLGYSLSYIQGTLIRSVTDITVGEIVEIRVADGSFTTEVKKVQ